MRMQAQINMNQQMQHVQVKQASPEIQQLPEKVVDTEKVNETEMNATRLTAAEMTKVLSQDQDPKYRQSEFFQFMSQIRDNEVEFAGGTRSLIHLRSKIIYPVYGTNHHLK